MLNFLYKMNVYIILEAPLITESGLVKVFSAYYIVFWTQMLDIGV